MRRDLVAVGDLIDAVLSRVARADVAPIVRLRRRWDTVAGEWANRCRPMAIRDGVLTVEVGSGMDASMLRFDTETLLAAVRRELGEDPPLNRLNIKVAAPSRGRDG